MPQKNLVSCFLNITWGLFKVSRGESAFFFFFFVLIALEAGFEVHSITALQMALLWACEAVTTLTVFISCLSRMQPASLVL